MSTTDLLSSTVNWPGKGLYGLKSSVLQTTENNLVKQTIVAEHMKNHYRRLHSARSAVDSKPPKAMVLGQKCRDRARKEMAQLVFTQNILDQFAGGSTRNTPRGRSSHSVRSNRFAQSQPTTARARSRSIESARRITRSLTMNGSMQNLRQNDNGLAEKLFGDGGVTQALTSMAALGKITSSARNKSSADVLDKHPDSFSQPEPEGYQPRLVKRDGDSCLRNNRAHYNPPRKAKARPSSASKEQPKAVPDENTQKEDAQLALREQLNRSMELRHDVEKKIKRAKSITTNPPALKKQSDEALKRFGLTERERLQYVRFMQEVTDAIIRNNLTTESAIEKLYEIHIDRNRGTLDEQRLRGLLEALKQDLGVQSSRKPDTYASVHKATNFDNQPLPPSTARENSGILTPKTPHDSRRVSSYDINEPFPWESEKHSDQQPASRRETKRSSLHHHSEDPLDDNYLFSPTSAPIKPKPRLSLQTKTEDHDRTDDIPHSTEHQSPKPKSNLLDTDWLSDPQPLPTTNENETEEVHHHTEQRIPSPENPPLHDSNTYDDDEFDENDDSDP